TIGFLSRISPDARFVVTTLNEYVYVVNFKDYRFLQVFYPTEGILGFWSRKTEEIQSLPGADDPQFVHCDPVWTPDGKTIVFARAKAVKPFSKDRPIALKPNDPNETPMQYDLYTMDFNEGKGGTPLPLKGASNNGMSNTFPKVSPDGKWIVFVKCRNGQLMRPDSRLWIIPVKGGEAREMRCNTSLMNSWHSFSPNGKWMVFSSKCNTPYTQMFLTHLDPDGTDSPPILIPDSTASNRASNIPEFVNTAYEDFESIAVPSVDYFSDLLNGDRLVGEGKYEEALDEYRKVLKSEPDESRAAEGLGKALWLTGKAEESIAHLLDYIKKHPNLPTLHV
ncbi:MAG: tetratricopeptide repeat protein, partial [SAR324 cluster bacterium]|nr:tetratricopeptide repeat protein [SAR324 cluster bacterium]